MISIISGFNYDLLIELDISNDISYYQLVDKLKDFKFGKKYYLINDGVKNIYTNLCPDLFYQNLNLPNILYCIGINIDEDDYLNFDVNGKIFIMSEIYKYYNNPFDEKRFIDIMEFMPDEFKNDKDIFMMSIKYSKIFNYASYELKNDKEYILKLLDKNECIIQYISDDLKNDKDIILKAINNPLILNYIIKNNYIDNHKRDREFIIEALKINCNILNYVCEEFKDDEELILLSLKYDNDSEIFRYVSNRLKNDIEFIKKAIKHKLDILCGVNPDLLNKEMILDIMKYNGGSLLYVPDKYKDDKDIVMEAITNNCYSIIHVSNRLRGDRDVGLKSIINNGINFLYLSKELKNNKEFINEAHKICTYNQHYIK